MNEPQRPDVKMWQILNLVLPSQTRKERYERPDYFARFGNKLANRVFPEPPKKKTPSDK